MSQSKDWNLEYDGAAPPLPRRLGTWKNAQNHFAQGAYFIWVEPAVTGIEGLKSHNVFVGVLRIRHHDDLSISGSGDLYLCSKADLGRAKRRLAQKMNQDSQLKLLQFPTSFYRHYFRLENLSENTHNRARLEFDNYSWGGEERGWKRQQLLSLELCLPIKTAPATKKDLRTYPVLNSTHTTVAEMGLVKAASDRARYAVVRVHDVDGLNTAGNKELWNEDLLQEKMRGGDGNQRDIDRDSRWLLELKTTITGVNREAAANYKKSRRVKWTRAQLNKYHDRIIEPALKATAGSADEWKYHFLVVRDIIVGGHGRPSGLMYDTGGKRPGDRARQGAAIAAGRKRRRKPSEEPKPLMRDKDLFNRIVLHELGHMQGLYHNDNPDPEERGLMRSHSYIDEKGGFKSATDLFHSPGDAARLWHLPDPWVRPGGLRFGYRYQETAVNILDLVPGDTPDLELEIKVEPAAISAGHSPMALELTLKNGTGEEIYCPNDRHIQPRHQRLGVLLRTPLGERTVVWPVRYPRVLEGLGSTPLRKQEKITYRVPWDESTYPERSPGIGVKPLNQAGIYEIEVHLMWCAKYKKDADPVLYRVTGSTRLRAS